MKSKALNNVSILKKSYSTERKNGSITFVSKEPDKSFEISSDTLSMIDSAVNNMKKGKVYGPIDLSEFDD